MKWNKVKEVKLSMYFIGVEYSISHVNPQILFEIFQACTILKPSWHNENIGHPRYKSCYNNFRSKSVSQSKTLDAQKHLFFYQACVTFTWLRFILHVLMYALN